MSVIYCLNSSHSVSANLFYILYAIDEGMQSEAFPLLPYGNAELFLPTFKNVLRTSIWF